MPGRCEKNIKMALKMAKELMCLADEGDNHRQDDSCGVLYGVIRDCAYKIRLQAEKERDLHKAKGRWSGSALDEDNREKKYENQRHQT